VDVVPLGKPREEGGVQGGHLKKTAEEDGGRRKPTCKNVEKTQFLTARPMQEENQIAEEGKVRGWWGAYRLASFWKKGGDQKKKGEGKNHSSESQRKIEKDGNPESIRKQL